MAVQLLCLTTNGGLPIFTRKKGDCENLPFSTVASLNGFHMFFKSLQVKLQVTHAEDGWTFLWQDFHNAITIIVCGRNLGEIVLHNLSELTYAAISLFVSRDEHTHPALIERIKKEMKNFMPVVELALEASITLMPGFTNCILATENSQLLQKLQDYSSQCGSVFCSLVINQQIAVATEAWWALNIIDRQTLLMLLNSSGTLQNDIAIYLSNKSPNVAYRFVTIPLSSNSVLCVICGSGPTYNDLNKISQSIFRNDALAAIQNVDRCIARGISDHVEVDPNILAMIFVNMDTKKCVFSRNMQQPLSSVKRLCATSAANNSANFDMLKRFFYHSLEVKRLLESEDNSQRQTDLLDQYWCSDYHKCYALSDDYHNTIFLLYMASVPTHTVKFISQKLLNSLLQEKNFCW